MDNKNTNLDNRVQFFSDNNQIFLDNSNVIHNNTVNDNSLFNNNDDVFFDNNKQDNSSFLKNNNTGGRVIEVEFFGGNRKKKDNKFFKLNKNKKNIFWFVILVLILVILLVSRLLFTSGLVDTYYEYYSTINKKESLATVIYNDNIIYNNGKLDDRVGAAEELVNCINRPIDLNKLPDSINSIVDEIAEYYNSSNDYFAFKYKDIYTGFSISHNEKQVIYAASAIKAPKDIYLYEMASLGKVNLKDELVYSKEYYNTGTGMIKISPFGSSYTIKDLIMYSTVYSDNAAHNMLMDKYGRNNMLSFWKEKGTEVIFTENNNWGMINANDASIYMEELYRFFKEDKVYGKELMDNFIDSKGKFIRNKDGDIVASKGGWSGSAIHDVGIVFDENPYIVVGLSNLGNTSEYSSYFNKVNDFAYRLHNEYWKYKMNICNNINQY